jgi:hypothetical protein
MVGLGGHCARRSATLKATARYSTIPAGATSSARFMQAGSVDRALGCFEAAIAIAPDSPTRTAIAARR